MKAIETVGLRKDYGRARGIVNVSLAVEEGEIFGFIGPNGAGKSTTIRSLLGFLAPTAGRASIFGLDCARESVAIKRQVGYMPSEPRFYDDMRVAEILSYAASLRGGGMDARIRELCELVDLDGKKRIEELSYGNRKKVSLVQALMHRPRLLVLDEPTSGLDPLIQRRFLELLEEERARGATIFLSSHVLPEVQRVCDRVAVIREGRIIEVLGMAELRSARYKRVRLEAASGGKERAEVLRGLPGIQEFSLNGSSCEFLFGGRMDVLLSALAGIALDNLAIEEPSLEDVFLHWYEEGGRAS